MTGGHIATGEYNLNISDKINWRTIWLYQTPLSLCSLCRVARAKLKQINNLLLLLVASFALQTYPSKLNLHLFVHTYLPRKFTPNLSSSWFRTILDVSWESSPSFKMTAKEDMNKKLLPMFSLLKQLVCKLFNRPEMSVYLPLQIESLRPMVRPPLHVFVVVPCVLSQHAIND